METIINAALGLIAIIAVVLAGIAVTFLMLKRKGYKDNNDLPSYMTKKVLSKPEQELYWKLRKTVPSAVILPQVTMAGYIQVDKSTLSNASDYKKAFNRIAQKRSDFLVCDRNFQPKLIIELDDRTHNKSKDANRDKLTESAGLKTLRLRAGKTPDTNELKKLITPHLSTV